MGRSGIEWTQETWNPLAGCSAVSAGCTHCYAAVMTKRLAAMGQAKYEGLLNSSGHFNGKINFDEGALGIPLGRKKPTVYFVNSMSDLFHENVPFEFIDRIFAVMALCPQHTFQVLTKRPERMAEYFHHGGHGEHGEGEGAGTAEGADERRWPLRNVWLGTSVENQAAADARIPHLLRCPAAVRFLSCEPLLGAVDLLGKRVGHGRGILVGTGWLGNGLDGRNGLDGQIHWVICGGESGTGARPMHPDWARGLRDQCVGAGVPFFFKQWGEWKPISEMTEEESNALYKSNRIAKEYEDQGALDELYGRRCKVEQQAIQYDGGEGFFVVDGHVGYATFKVGKHAAGRVLDGRVWDEVPGVFTTESTKGTEGEG